jgi:hypothetical protein
MTLTPGQLPNDPAKIKVLLLKQQASAEKREASLMLRINSLLETLRLESTDASAPAVKRHPDRQSFLMNPSMKKSQRQALRQSKRVLSQKHNQRVDLVSHYHRTCRLFARLKFCLPRS